MNSDSGAALRPYVKPEITVIDFAAEEVMAVGCKTATGGTTKLASPGCLVSNCFTEGS